MSIFCNMWTLFIRGVSLVQPLLRRMQSLKEKQRRDVIVQYKNDHPTLSNYAISKYFQQLSISKSTVYSILQTYATRGSTDRSVGSGRVVAKMPEKCVRALVNAVKSSKSPSQRLLARKHGISQSFVCKIIHSQGLRSYKKEKAPRVSEKQKRGTEDSA